jgi:chromosome segregation ATPase
MRITAVSIENFKRVRDVRITPDADRTLILLGGKNRQGKSSTLDALTAAFGGKRAQPSDPVRHGAEEATIRVELDGGALVIHRVIQEDGECKLEVRDAYGPLKAPQQELDKLIGARFLDPHAFLRLAAKEQRAQLMRLIPDAKRIDELDAKRERAFTRRKEVGRDLKKAEGELARLDPVEVGTPIDVAAITAQRDKIVAVEREAEQLAGKEQAAKREAEGISARIGQYQDELASKRRQLEQLQREIAELDAVIETTDARLAAQDKVVSEAAAAKANAFDALKNLAPLRAEIDGQLAKADAHNRTVYAAEAHAKRRTEAEQTVAALSKETDEITKLLGVIDERKAAILQAAKLPVEGLSVDDEGVTLNDVPFSQASGAEQFRVALALAIAASPGLDDIWIRDGALLDEEHLELVEAHAKANSKRVWIERVGTNDPGVIEIRDGKVAADIKAA